jgi:NADPH-dependent 2,4-dienoyl-CoA reductase/sulfur reductase-like enzyme
MQVSEVHIGTSKRSGDAANYPATRALIAPRGAAKAVRHVCRRQRVERNMADFDIAVIGAGASGVAIARNPADRGISAVLAEREMLDPRMLPPMHHPNRNPETTGLAEAYPAPRAGRPKISIDPYTLRPQQESSR